MHSLPWPGEPMPVLRDMGRHPAKVRRSHTLDLRPAAVKRLCKRLAIAALDGNGACRKNMSPAQFDMSCALGSLTGERWNDSRYGVHHERHSAHPVNHLQSSVGKRGPGTAVRREGA